MHCHSLPDIDDGAKKMDDSLVMAREAVAEGITYTLATPRYKNVRWANEKDNIYKE